MLVDNIIFDKFVTKDVDRKVLFSLVSKLFILLIKRKELVIEILCILARLFVCDILLFHGGNDEKSNQDELGLIVLFDVFEVEKVLLVEFLVVNFVDNKTLLFITNDGNGDGNGGLVRRLIVLDTAEDDSIDTAGDDTIDTKLLLVNGVTVELELKTAFKGDEDGSSSKFDVKFTPTKKQKIC